MRKKIIFITWALEVGGAERLLVKLVQNIPQDTYEVKVVCVTRKGVWAQELEAKGIDVVSMDKKVGLDLGVLFRLRSYLVREDPDIVNTSIWTADLWGRAAAILAGVKNIIVTEQNVDVWKRWYHKAIDRFLFRWTKYVICVSENVVKFYHDEFGFPHSQLWMIPNAIDLGLFDLSKNYTGLRQSQGLTDNAFLFVCPARLHPQKAHQVLIEASSILLAQGNTQFHVLLVGDGERKDELSQLVISKGLSQQIHFLGLRQDIPEILLQCNAFLLSSDYEGLSLAILEGMAAGLSIVATDVGGNSQLIANGINGYLSPQQNSKQLAASMLKVIEAPGHAKKMGLAGRKIVEETYSIQKIASSTIELFEICMNDK
jgi:glycosyltransferase involved in cell wall biosynthesis